jgi:nucleotide-binding universal stress UspA family protein
MLNFKNILYPIDLDSKNITSLEKALEFAQMFRCPIHILYVNDTQAGYRHPTDHEDAVALRVKEIVPETLLQNMNITYAISKGDTAEEIVKYAQKHQIDLIIFGHKHHGKLYSSLFDSTDVNIIDTALLPVLVIPEK